jgi:hypothetical protein
MQAHVYNYRPDTFEFTFAGQLEFDPLMGEPMIQSFATIKEPLPSKTGFTVNFINNEWVYLEIPREKPEQPQEPYYVWDEESWSWVIDENAKSKWLANKAKSAVYTLLDQTAKQYDYRNFAEVAQFVLSGTWKAEAESLIAWQDEVWTKAYELLKEPITSIDDFVVQLPKYVPTGGS